MEDHNASLLGRRVPGRARVAVSAPLGQVSQPVGRVKAETLPASLNLDSPLSYHPSPPRTCLCSANAAEATPACPSVRRPATPFLLAVR